MSTPTTIPTHRPAGDPPPGRDWRHDAACRGAEPEQFFPLPGAKADAALEHCSRCSVTAECLADALRGGHGGIRGGLTDDARRKLRREGRAGWGR